MILGQSIRVTRIVIGRAAEGPYLICGEPDPMVSYTYSDRELIRVHAACDALWTRERAAG